jgi:membrane protein required for colicin V production
MALLNIDEPWAPFLCMLILYVGTSLVIWIAYGYIRETIKRVQLKSFDAQAGALLGAIKGALLCMLITLFAVTLLGDGIRRQVVLSRSGGFISKSINQLNTLVPPEIHEILDPLVSKFNNKMAEPLPPEPPGGPQGWLGTFIPASETPANPNSGFFGSFQTSSPPTGTGNEIAPGINLNVDTKGMLDEFGNRLKTQFDNALQNNSGTGDGSRR